MHSAVILTMLQVIFLEGLLSLDNAAVLGALVLPLPDDRPVPYPTALRRLGPSLDRVLGPQRAAALKVGLLGAYVGRAVMVALAAVVIQQLVLRIIGGLYLLFLAIDYLGGLEAPAAATAKAEGVRRQEHTTFWGVVLTVELVDLAFSLDNVVAVVALSQDYWVVVTGVAIGIVLMRFAAGLFSRVTAWEPRLAIAGYLVIAAISIQLLLQAFWNIHFVAVQVAGATISPELQQFSVSVLLLAGTVATARVTWLAPLRVVWRPLARVCTGVRSFVYWLSRPVRALVHVMTRMTKEHTS